MLSCVAQPSLNRCSPLSYCGSLQKPQHFLQLHCSHPHHTFQWFLLFRCYSIHNGQWSPLLPTMAIAVPSYPQWPLKSPPTHSFSVSGISLSPSSISSLNCIFSFSPQPVCGAYALTMLIISPLRATFTQMILSDLRLTDSTPLFISSFRIIPTPFLLPSSPM